MKLALYVFVGFAAVVALIAAGICAVFDNPLAPALALVGGASVLYDSIRLGLQQ